MTAKHFSERPWKPAAVLLMVCLVPMLLTGLGVDFGSPPVPAEFAGDSKGMLSALTGSFVHTLLEWTAFTIAVLTTVVALSHYRATGDATTLALSIALFCAGMIDAFHTLAADGLVGSIAPRGDFIPFTWAICRIFNGGLMLVGIMAILRTRPDRKTPIFALSWTFILFAGGAIAFSALSPNLPQTQFPDALITRPFDIFPLVGFSVAGLYAYRKLHERVGSAFTYALLLSVIPDLLTQMHMAFGSSRLFDAHFNIAHSLKILAYLIPFMGLTADYVFVYRRQEEILTETDAARKKLTQKNVELQRANGELERFAYLASHDLQEPLRMVASFSKMLDQSYGDGSKPLDATGRKWLNYLTSGATRMQGLINSLLALSSVEAKPQEMSRVDVEHVIEQIQTDLGVRIEEEGAKIFLGELPPVHGAESQVRQVFQNLISNGIKFHGEEPPVIHIQGEEKDGMIEYTVRDEGIGIAGRDMGRIYEAFFRGRGTKNIRGSGIGLSICEKIVTLHGGKIRCESELGVGTTFFITFKGVSS